MLSRRAMILSAPFAVVFLAACRKEPRAEASTTKTSAGPVTAFDPVDDSFKGCAGSCGSRSKKDRAEVRPQPGAAQGDAVTCPVSGAVFRITERSPQRVARGKALYFCCEACAAWFGEHEAEVLAKRGLS